jgi:N6-adenosine-specific RNA methylase IME4/ParB-like chromosome segregation protein Spo0J
MSIEELERAIVIDLEFESLIPPLSAVEFKQLEANIQRDGCTDPLTVWNGILVDGHNRYKICQKHGIAFKTETLKDCLTRDHVMVWIDERQLGRRNVSLDQRADIGADRMERLSRIARVERAQTARASVKKRNPVKSDLSVKTSDKSEKNPGQKKDTRKSVAKELDIPERKLRQAAEVRKADKDVSALVKDGTIKLTEAKKLIALPNEARKLAVKAVEHGTEVRAAIRDAKRQGYNARVAATKPKPLEGTYRIFYIDPPWKYHGLNQADEYGHAEAHYDCLDDEQLMDFKPDGKRLIKDLADENAILFLWVTAPLLERCFPILNAWGFKYKTNFIWDKENHVMGFYSSVRHEHLIVATKGSCTPDVKKLYDSVQPIKRTEHSRKPEKFYEIIETLYGHGRKLEIFARSGRAGWDSVGNEVYKADDYRAAA